jgi:hypothetical protein
MYSDAMAPQEALMAKEEMGYAETMPANGSLNSESGSTAEVPAQRKWIITMDISAETEDLDGLLEALNQEIASLGGYVEGQNIHNGSAYASRRYRSASLTVRIPADRADQFASNVAGIANVVRSNKNLEDITLTYTATENRIKALETEQDRLLELLAEAETMSDLLEIEARLTDVRYELESYTSQKRVYDNQVDYATIYLNLSEVQEYTPVEEPTFVERIRNTFSDALEGLGNGIVDLTVFLIGNSPYLLVYGILGTAAVLIIRRFRSARASRKGKKADTE